MEHDLLLILLEISSFVLEIFMFLYYANEESDDVIIIIVPKNIKALNQEYL